MLRVCETMIRSFRYSYTIVWNQSIQIVSYKTSKFDWTLDNIRTKEISRLLESHGPHFEFHLRSFICSMPKEGSIGVVGEKIICNQLI